ncbi:hypothetical protein LUZ60_005783 [Juncus effusus]|nr:hypothetical protein LUZ60_005783 [Juncus effusus]
MDPRHLIGQVPWLWLPHKQFSPSLSFYNITQPKIYDFDLPDVARERPVACSHGWFLLENDMGFSLLNPITKELKSNRLPSLAAPLVILAFAKNEKTIDPFSFGIHQAWDLGFCRVGDNSWTILKLEEYGRGYCNLLDFNYKNGLVYTINNKGQLTIYDLRDLSMKILVPIDNRMIEIIVM